VPEQGGLADARLAPENQHMTLASAHTRDESIERAALVDTIEQSS
jgi:hypothetical protein